MMPGSLSSIYVAAFCMPTGHLDVEISMLLILQETTSAKGCVVANLPRGEELCGDAHLEMAQEEAIWCLYGW